MGKEYFICSKAVIDAFPECEHSKSLKSGYDHLSNFYIAVLDYPEVERYYKKRLPESVRLNFWCQELVPGLMDVSKFTLRGLRANGLFREIEHVLGLTTLRNVAMTTYEICNRFGFEPIEFANKVLTTK